MSKRAHQSRHENGAVHRPLQVKKHMPVISQEIVKPIHSTSSNDARDTSVISVRCTSRYSTEEDYRSFQSFLQRNFEVGLLDDDGDLLG